MSTTPSRQQNYITLIRNNTNQFWSAYKTLLASQEEWNAQDYGTTLADGVGTNEGITAADVGSVIFATMDAVKALMTTGHSTNITSLLE